jgi:DNA-binding SARP family transcriptional activator
MAKLITAYYVAERQSDALEANRRLKTALADDPGIDPGPTRLTTLPHTGYEAGISHSGSAALLVGRR